MREAHTTAVVVAALVALAPAVGGLAPSLGDQPVTDAWLSATYAQLEDRYGGSLVDVGVATEPVRHVAVLFDGPPPTDVPELHPSLDTQAWDVSGATPITHGPIMPVMLRTAHDVPDRVRPGAWMTEPFACTLAHLVEDEAGNLYALTAGHCVDTPAPRSQDLGRTVEIAVEAGPTQREFRDVGTVVAFENDGIGDDFALVDLDDDAQARADPSTAGWGGPTGLAVEPEPGTVHHYGFGSAATWAHDATRCRAGATPGFWGAKSYAFFGVLAFGDSGSPAQTASGKALGINTHVSFDLTAGNNRGTRTTEAIDGLEQRTSLDLSLVEGGQQADVCQVT